jgi:hypothetical protein
MLRSFESFWLDSFSLNFYFEIIFLIFVSLSFYAFLKDI